MLKQATYQQVTVCGTGRAWSRVSLIDELTKCKAATNNRHIKSYKLHWEMSVSCLWVSPTVLSYSPPRQLLKGILCFSFWLSTWLLPTWLSPLDAISQFCFDWFVVRVSLMQGSLFRAHVLPGDSLFCRTFLSGFWVQHMCQFLSNITVLCLCVCGTEMRWLLTATLSQTAVFVSGLPFTLNKPQEGVMNGLFFSTKGCFVRWDEDGTFLTWTVCVSTTQMWL